MAPRSVIDSLLSKGGEEPWEKTLPPRGKDHRKKGRKRTGDIIGIVLFTAVCASIAIACEIGIPVLWDHLKQRVYETMRDIVAAHEEL